VAADGTAREYGYDEATGQLQFSRDAQGGVVARHYDHRGRLSRLTNENDETYRFVWGDNDRLTEEHGLDGVVTRYEYDTCDRISARIFAAGTDSALVHRFTRDADGQLTHKQTPDGITQYQYDRVRQLTAATFTPEGGEPQTLALAYDKAGQMTGEQGINGAVGYQYDALGNRTAVTLPDGRSLKTLYYGSGHALQVMLDTQLITEFSRDALHRETGRTQGALNSGWRYDRHGRVCERWTGRTPHAALAQMKEQWQYDLRDNLTQVQQSSAPFTQRQYGYDGADRIIRREETPETDERYRYDRASNPLDYHVIATHWQHNRVVEYRGIDYKYDIYGRTTEKRRTGERWLYRYDSEHRLTQVLHQPVIHTRPECVVDFSYDALGRRVSKRVRYQRMDGVGGGPQYRARETRFLWEGPRLLAEYNGDNVQVYAYSDQNSFAPLARIDGAGEVYYFHCLVNGQPEAMTDSAGDTVWCGKPDVRGKITSENSQLAVMERGSQNLMMQGQYLDRETGLHYNLHRYYDPDSGRFTQHDPIGLRGGLNLYQYAPNVLGWVDPWGLLKCGLTGNEVGDASNLPVIKPGTPEWKRAVDSMKNNSGAKPNFRTANRTDAEKLLKGAKSELSEYPEYFGSKNYSNKKGFEHHPNESHTINAPENNLPHIKWSDYSTGKKSPDSGKGHVFYE
jgi:RHS repeat-associated protein